MERGHIENYCTNFTTFRFSEIDASGSVPHSTTTLCREKKLSLHKAAGIFQTCSSAANCLSNIQSWDLNMNLFKKNKKAFIFQFLEFKRSWQYLETWSLSILYVQFWGRQKKNHHKNTNILTVICIHFWGLFIHFQSDKGGYIGTSNGLIGLRTQVLIMREQKPAIVREM